MNQYKTQDIRNVVILGHGGCGKTDLVDAMAHVAGTVQKAGRVEQGNTISDFDKEEIKRGISIGTTLVPIEWEGTKINILDTPGYFDFVGEVESAVGVADAAIIVVSGRSGVQAGTERAWELCEKFHLPRMFFVTEMDMDNASFREVVEKLTELYGRKIAPFHQPLRENENLVGYINVVKNAGRRWVSLTQSEECEIPEYSQPNLKICRDALMEAVAETSEENMERYFNGETFTEEEIKQALRTNVIFGDMAPVTMGSALGEHNIHNLLTDIIKYFPSPAQVEVTGEFTKSGQPFSGYHDDTQPFSAYIFKTLVDPFIGKYSLFKVTSGVLKTDMVIYNEEKEQETKVSKLYILRGNKPIEVRELVAGDIGALAKLPSARTGNTLSTKANPIAMEKIPLSKPYTYLQYKAKNKGDEDKLSQALSKLMHEDLTLRVVNDAENRQTLLYGMGEQHLEVAAGKLKSKFNVEIELSEPKVAFRETIKKRTEVQGRYKKQSGGHGQFGDVKLVLEPSGENDKPYVFEEKIVGGVVPKQYFPAVEKGIIESVQAGPLAAYPVVGVKATLIDGSYHSVDSSEFSFKAATQLAFKKGFLEASPVLLEPIVALKVTVPESYTGDIMGDLNKRRGRVLGMNPEGKKQIIEAEVPMLEMFRYGTDLRSMTGGRGDFSYEFVRYEQTPPDIQTKEVAARADKVDRSVD